MSKLHDNPYRPDYDGGKEYGSKPTAHEIAALQDNDRLRAENAKLGRLTFDLAEACRAFLEAQDSPAPRDLLTLAAIKASAALAKAGQ